MLNPFIRFDERSMDNDMVTLTIISKIDEVVLFFVMVLFYSKN